MGDPDAAIADHHPTTTESTPIDLVPDDVLTYLVDCFLDDRSLGACLLAWRRFHAVDDRALLRRKYRLATVLSLCVADDDEGLEYALERPEVFGALTSRRLATAYKAAAARGHGRIMRRLADKGGLAWPLASETWSNAVLAAVGPDGRTDMLAWFCRPDNQPVEWDARRLVIACAKAIQRGLPVDEIAHIVDTVSTATGVCVDTPPGGWHPFVPQPACGDTRALINMAEDMMRGRATLELNLMVHNRHQIALLRCLVGDRCFGAALRAQYPAAVSRIIDYADVDSAVWIYDQVKSDGEHRTGALAALLERVARAGRLDLIDAIEPEIESLNLEAAWTRAFDSAATAGHSAAAERILVHFIDTDALIDAWVPCSDNDTRISTPLVLWPDNKDLARVLLDRRPRPCIPQDHIDERVDATIRLVVGDALAHGRLSLMRSLYAREPRLVGEEVCLLRAHDDLSPLGKHWLDRMLRAGRS